jgi:hypothetical protein
MMPSPSGHLHINGLQLYYEAHGELGASEAMPLLLIPGAFQSTDSMKRWVAGTSQRHLSFLESGRAAMWWIDEHGVLAHAVASNGDLAGLFAWWRAQSGG